MKILHIEFGRFATFKEAQTALSAREVSKNGCHLSDSKDRAEMNLKYQYKHFNFLGGRVFWYDKCTYESKEVFVINEVVFDTNTKENEMIALFMGMQKTYLGWFDNEGWLKLPNSNDNTFDELLFDKDWNWLIPVIDKIYRVLDNYSNQLNDFDKITKGIPLVETTYEACVHFIKSYAHPERDLIKEKILDLQQEVFRYQMKWSKEIDEICNTSSDYKFSSTFSYNKDRLEAFANGLIEFTNEETTRN